MRRKTPYFGPYAGKPCRVFDDGSLEPLPELAAPERIHPVAVPDAFGSDDAGSRVRLGIDRTAKVLHEQYVKSGSDLSYTDAQERVRSARTRQDNIRGS